MAASWREPTCPACRFDFHRIRSGPEKGLGIYTKCWNCEAKDAAIAAQEKAAERRRVIVSESERHWIELRRRERGEGLAEELGDEGPLPNPRRSSRLYWNRP